MKNPLRKRLLRELRQEMGKYLVVFILMVATIGFVSGFLVADGSMLIAYDNSFEKYNIDSLQFAESNNYYAYHIKDYEEIYANVTDSLERLKVALKEIELKEEKKKKKETDSINALKLKDSLKIQNKKDSLATKGLKKAIKKEEGVLINPASDNNPRSYK